MKRIGTKVIVTTCSGEHRGKITGYTPWGFNLNKDAYQVKGDNIITITRHLLLDKGQELKKGNMCKSCNSKPCCFESMM